LAVPRLRHLAQPSPVLFLCLFASQAGMLVLSPILPEIAHEFGVSTATAGQLRAVSGATGGVTAVLLAIAPRRPGARELLSAGAALVALGSAASAAAPHFAVLAAAQAVLGIGIGLLVAVGIAAAGEWPAADRRPHVLAWTIAGMPAAWIAGMPVVGAAASLHWRAAWIAVPTFFALLALTLVRLRPADAPSRRTGDSAGAWRRPDVARFAAGELLANAAWASVLTYGGALLLTSYALSPAVVALGLGAMAVAMVPGTFTARRRVARATPGLLTALTLLQGVAVVLLCAVRPAAVLTLALLAAMAFVNGSRSMIASALGMDTAPDDKVAVMAVRAAANQFGYLLGAAAGGLALALAGFTGLGVVLAAMFAAAVLVHDFRPRTATPPPQEELPVFSATAYTIRIATPDDEAALRWLADIDSQDPLDPGPVLVGELDGKPQVALALTDGRVIANPFLSTAPLLTHVRMRAGALQAYERMPSLSARIRAALSGAVLVRPSTAA
jgi:predicted MFS family arabinose efflux permease